MTNPTKTLTRPQFALSTRSVWLLFAAIFLAVYFASLFTPPLMDDVDSTHAQAAQYFAEHSDWISAHINGLRYIEKPPLPYWTVAVLFHIFGQNVFSAHLPNTLAMLGLTWLAWWWVRRGWGERAGLYAGLGVLTSIGPFLFTRFIIPEAQLSLFLLIALYCLLTGFEPGRAVRFYWMWAFLGLALMTKGLIAPTFFIGAAVPFLIITGLWRRWRELKPVTGTLLFLAISAPWHILCGLANPDQGHAVGNHPTFGNVHGFFYFYFINEHYLRFFGLRYPHDYNKLPGVAYWLLHLVWIFPWSLFLPALVAVAWKTRHHWMQYLRSDGLTEESQAEADGLVFNLRFRARSIWLLSLFSAWTLLFFSISTNQEYYTFPVWPPLVMLIAAVVAGIEEEIEASGKRNDFKGLGKIILMGILFCIVVLGWIPIFFRRVREFFKVSPGAWILAAQLVFAVIGLLSAAVLGWGLWESRHLPYVDDVGTLLAHRRVGDYTLAMSHLFDMTVAAFAALRLPAILAAIALLIGPALGWLLRIKGRHLAATISVALTMSVFLIAAHIAFARFDPMLGSKRMADTILAKASPADTIIIYGEQSEGSSIIFYTHYFFGKPAMFVYPRCGQHGEGSPLLWGSCYPDAPNIFLSTEQLSSVWGTGERKWLFAQDLNQLKAEQVLAGRLILVQTIADKALWTDRPLP